MLGQPYGVCFPLLLLGGLTAGISWQAAAQIRRQYDAHDQRQMAALDAG
jgi:hypothetical protein